MNIARKWFGLVSLCFLVLFPSPNGSFLPVRCHAEVAAAGPGAGLGGAGRGVRIPTAGSGFCARDGLRSPFSKEQLD